MEAERLDAKAEKTISLAMCNKFETECLDAKTGKNYVAGDAIEILNFMILVFVLIVMLRERTTFVHLNSAHVHVLSVDRIFMLSASHNAASTFTVTEERCSTRSCGTNLTTLTINSKIWDTVTMTISSRYGPT